MASGIRRSFITSAIVLAAVFSATTVAAAATPILLSLPQSIGFTLLGHSCGGIQERPYTTGFDPASGFPAGDVYISTSCGGSGRGGGGHSTTYSAWVGETWDFTGATVSYSRLSSARTVNPTFSAYDSHGNEIYNQFPFAYLLLAPGFVPTPRLLSIATHVGPASGGTSVTINGTGFTGATAVSFGSVHASSFTVTNSTTISAVSPHSGAGTVDVTVTSAGGTSATSAADQFTFVPPPSISSVSPNRGLVYGGTYVTITGANLSGATSVTFGGTPTWFQVNSDGSLTAPSPGSEGEAGSVNVRVTSIGGTSAQTAADRFTYTLPPKPTVSGIAPSSGLQDGGTAVTISGSGFTYASQVNFGGLLATFAVNSDNSITAYAPTASPGAVDVTVISAGGTSAVSPSDQFTYTADQVPVVSGVSPNSGPQDGWTAVTVTGSGFTNAAEVDFGGVAASFSVNDDTSITAYSPTAAPGVVDVTVISAGGTSATTSADQFTYTADPPPVVSSVSPIGGPMAGDTAVTITGSGFTYASTVYFGGLAAGFAVNSDGSITAYSPSVGSPQTVDITVTATGGTSAVVSGDQFTYS